MLASTFQCLTAMFLGAQLPCGPAPPHTSAAGSQSPGSGLPRRPPALTYGGRCHPHPMGARVSVGRQHRVLPSREGALPGPSLAARSGAWCHGVSEVLYSF